MPNPRRFVVACVAAAMCHAAWVPVVQAGELIGAEEVVQRHTAAAQAGVAQAGDVRTRLQQWIDRGDVAAALVERGVSPDEARARVAALTDAQAAQLLAEIDHAPAGASEVIGTVVLVGVLLVFSDILGFTRIFPFLRPAR